MSSSNTDRIQVLADQTSALMDRAQAEAQCAEISAERISENAKLKNLDGARDYHARALRELSEIRANLDGAGAKLDRIGSLLDGGQQ